MYVFFLLLIAFSLSFFNELSDQDVLRRFHDISKTSVSKETLPFQPQPTVKSPQNPPTTLADSQYPAHTEQDSYDRNIENEVKQHFSLYQNPYVKPKKWWGLEVKKVFECSFCLFALLTLKNKQTMFYRVWQFS